MITIENSNVYFISQTIFVGHYTIALRGSLNSSVCNVHALHYFEKSACFDSSK